MSSGPGTRQEKAAETRRRVLKSAAALFLEKGFAATSTREVAEASGVTERTVFNIVASKGQLLREVMVTEVFGEDPAPLLQRRDFGPVLEARSVQEFLDAYTRWVTRLHTRTASFAEVIRAAGSVDPGAADLWRWGNARQVDDCESVVRWLGERGWLRRGTRARQVAVSLAVLSGHETYWRLVEDCAWSPSTYRRWLARQCQAALPLEGTQGV